MQLPTGLIRRRQTRGPSLQAVLVAFVSLVILLIWLNFVLTQETESIGREIQMKTGELRAVERRNGALLGEISEAGSERTLAERAKALGYRPQMPVFLTVDEPIPETTGDDWETGGALASLTEKERQVLSFDPLWDLLNRQFGSSGTESAP